MPDRELVITNNILKVIKSSNILILTAIGVTTKSELLEADKILRLQNKSLTGQIVFI